MDTKSEGRDYYRSPLAGRYASKEMLRIFSERSKIKAWRRLWVALADVQMDLGLDITEEQVKEMRAAVDDIDFEMAESLERETRHDVMAHIKTFAAACPKAAGVIHLGATSCFVADNAELIHMIEACQVIRKRIVNVISALSKFAMEYKEEPTLAYTHFQPAQLTTVGKRASLWLQDLVMDLEDIEYFMENLGFRGVKGTTGTQASYLELFNGDHFKVEQLDRMVTQAMGFHRSYPVTGQTYPRKVDAKLLSVLAGVAASAGKFAADMRLLAHERELEEPFLKTQVGSSAMAYKRNPMRCERISSLSRYAISLVENAYSTAANQWLERTLDDSAGRRIVIPESFLAVEAILILYRSVAEGIVVNENILHRNIQDELSFMATENILMAAVQAGGDRQELHEKIRQHSMEARKRMKQTGEASDLLERLRKDEAFANVMAQEEQLLKPKKYIGCCDEQVQTFIGEIVTPLLVKRHDLMDNVSDEVMV
ncbi:MAG: adenylosuccinate lyase [Planctomycetota bacterium]|jgi:adenylosuccinate lyase